MDLAVNTVTLRSSTAQEAVSIIAEAGFQAVEWAGDAHVPPGDKAAAAEARDLCGAMGIAITSYGAYYQCDRGGPAENGPFAFNQGAEAALASAQALGVSDIRVWAGRRASSVADPAYRAEVAERLTQFCDQSSALGMRVHLEFHRNTLTDTAASALALLDAVSRDNLFSYWQPRHGARVEENLADIEALGDRLSNVHVFHWLLKEPGGFEVDRRPLAEGRERWAAYLAALESMPGRRYAMLEFVRGDAVSQFREDAKVLHELNAAQGR